MERHSAIEDAAVQSVSSTCSYLLGSPNTRRLVDQRIQKLTSVRNEAPETYKECRKRYVKMTSLRHKCFRLSQELVDEEATKKFLDQPDSEESFWFRASVIAQGSKAGLLWDRLVNARVEKLRRTMPERIYSIACDKALPPVEKEKLKEWKGAFGFVYGDELMVAYDGLNRMLAEPNPSLSEDTVGVLRRFRDGLRTTGLLVNTVKIGNGLVEKDDDLDDEVADCVERLMGKYCDQLKALKAGEFSLFSAGSSTHAVLVMVVRQDDGTFSQVYFNTGYKMLTKDDTDKEGKVRCFVRHDALSEETLLKPYYWTSHAIQPCQSKEQSSEQMDECNAWITAIGSQGSEWSGSFEEMKLLRMHPQFQGTCAWRCLMAAFKYLMLAPPHGDKNNFVQYRQAKELWLRSTLKGVPKISSSGKSKLLYLQAQKRLNRGSWTRMMCNAAESPTLYSSAIKMIEATSKPIPATSTERYQSLRNWEKFIVDYGLASLYCDKTSEKKSPLFMKYRIRGNERDWGLLEQRASEIGKDEKLSPADQAMALCELFELAPVRKAKHRRMVWIAKILDDLPYEAAGELISNLTILHSKEAPEIIEMFIRNESETMRAALCCSLDSLTPFGYEILVDLCVKLCRNRSTRDLGKQCAKVLWVSLVSYVALLRALADEGLLDTIPLLDPNDSGPAIKSGEVQFLIDELEALEGELPEKSYRSLVRMVCRSIYVLGMKKMGSFVDWIFEEMYTMLPFLFNANTPGQILGLELFGRLYHAESINKVTLDVKLFFPKMNTTIFEKTKDWMDEQLNEKPTERLLYAISGAHVTGNKLLAQTWTRKMEQQWKGEWGDNKKLYGRLLEQVEDQSV